MGAPTMESCDNDSISIDISTIDISYRDVVDKEASYRVINSERSHGEDNRDKDTNQYTYNKGINGKKTDTHAKDTRATNTHITRRSLRHGHRRAPPASPIIRPLRRRDRPVINIKNDYANTIRRSQRRGPAPITPHSIPKVGIKRHPIGLSICPVSNKGKRPVCGACKEALERNSKRFVLTTIWGDPSVRVDSVSYHFTLECIQELPHEHRRKALAVLDEEE